MNQVENFLERPKLYYNIDGVGELSMGFMAMAFAFLGWMQLHAPRESVWHSMYLFIVYVGLTFLILKFGSKAIKNRITYPRTGFVEYRRHETVWLPMIFAACLAILTAVALQNSARFHWNLTTILPLFGVLLAAGYYRIARTVRWKWIAASFMAFASLLIAVNPGGLLGSLTTQLLGTFWLTMTLCGAIYLISGGISLCLYIHHMQAPEQESQ
jgi:hypothetical protein